MLKKVLRLMDLLFCDILLLVLSLFIRRDNNRIAIGSWCGERYADNSKYLAEYISSHYPTKKIYWVGNNNLRKEVVGNLKNVEFLAINTFKANTKLLTCKYMFFTQMHTADISRYYVYRKAVLCYLHHGMPIKKWGQDGLNQKISINNPLKKAYFHINGFYKPYDYFVTSSPLHDKTNCTALSMHRCTMDKNIHSGTPRNDIYFCNLMKNTFKYKNKYSNLLHFSVEKKIVMYLPTYRRKSDSVFSFSLLDEQKKEQIISLLKKWNAVLVEKSHVAEKTKIDAHVDENIIFADCRMNVQEMMYFADVLISDYSGAFLDYLMLDRPIIHFAYDYEYYKNVDSGLYYDIDDFSAGPVVEDYDDLLYELNSFLSGKDEWKKKRAYVKKKYMTYEKGRASEEIIKRVLNMR